MFIVKMFFVCKTFCICKLIFMIYTNYILLWVYCVGLNIIILSPNLRNNIVILKPRVFFMKQQIPLPKYPIYSLDFGSITFIYLVVYKVLLYFIFIAVKRIIILLSTLFYYILSLNDSPFCRGQII